MKDLLDQLIEAKEFSPLQIEEILMYVECGHTIDSAMQTVLTKQSSESTPIRRQGNKQRRKA